MAWGGIKITAADKWFSFYVRFLADWSCQVPGCNVECKRRKYNNPDLPMAKIECAHFFSRANKSTRLDPEAAMSICFNCHRYYTDHTTEWESLLKECLGEDQFWLLKKKSQTPMVGYKSRHKDLGRQFKDRVVDMAREQGKLWIIGVAENTGE